jgi:hypothetical protein
MHRATGKYEFGEHGEVVFEIPETTGLMEAIQQAKQLSNEFLTRIYENTHENEPVKAKKIGSDSEECAD